MMTNGGLTAGEAILLGDRGRGSDNGGWMDGGWGWIWIIFLFAIFGWGNGGFGFGNGGNGMNGALTRSDICSEFNFNNLESAVRGIANGLCSLGYDMAAQIATVNANLAAGFAGVNNAVCTLGYQNAQLINGLENTVQNGFNASNIVALQNQNALQTQLAQCCCENREGQAQIRYDMATNTCALQTSLATGFRDVIDSQNAGTRAILDYLCQEKISDLQAENQSLKLKASQAAQNTFIADTVASQTAQLINRIAPYPSPAYIVSPPYAIGYGYGGYNNFGYGNSCGCGCGA